MHELTVLAAALARLKIDWNHDWGGPMVMGVSQNAWFLMENPMKLDDLGVALFQETTMRSRNKPVSMRKRRGSMIPECSKQADVNLEIGGGWSISKKRDPAKSSKADDADDASDMNWKEYERSYPQLNPSCGSPQDGRFSASLFGLEKCDGHEPHAKHKNTPQKKWGFPNIGVPANHPF